MQIKIEGVLFKMYLIGKTKNYEAQFWQGDKYIGSILWEENLTSFIKSN